MQIATLLHMGLFVAVIVGAFGCGKREEPAETNAMKQEAQVSLREEVSPHKEHAPPATREAANASQPAWQSSWDKFLQTLAEQGKLPEYSFPSMFPASKKFVGKTVTWEGTLGEVQDVKTRVRIQMPASRKLTAASGKIVRADSVQLQMKAGAFEKWRQLPEGTKVQFKATVPELFYIFATLGGVDGTPILIILLDDAEPL